MKRLEESNAVSEHLSGNRSVLDDSAVLRAMEEYSAALKAGRKPDREAFLSNYPEIAPFLADCLDGLEFICSAAPEISQADGARSTSSTADIGPATPLGDYQIIREIGRGGMGVVYEAEQLSLGRRVALKVLPFASALDTKQLQRFKNEAHAAAHLQHQNIVPVYAVGCERGVHFYAMQFVERQTLAAIIQELRQVGGVENRGSTIDDRRYRRVLPMQRRPVLTLPSQNRRQSLTKVSPRLKKPPSPSRSAVS